VTKSKAHRYYFELRSDRACCTLLIYPSSLWGVAALRSFTCTPSLRDTEMRKYDHHWCGRNINRVVQTADGVGGPISKKYCKMMLAAWLLGLGAREI